MRVIRGEPVGAGAEEGGEEIEVEKQEGEQEERGSVQAAYRFGELWRRCRV